MPCTSPVCRRRALFRFLFSALLCAVVLAGPVWACSRPRCVTRLDTIAKPDIIKRGLVKDRDPKPLFKEALFAGSHDTALLTLLRRNVEATASFATAPQQFMPLFISYILYRLETNIRAAAILGFVGAGGIGFYIQTYLRMVNYRRRLCLTGVARHGHGREFRWLANSQGPCLSFSSDHLTRCGRFCMIQYLRRVASETTQRWASQRPRCVLCPQDRKVTASQDLRAPTLGVRCCDGSCIVGVSAANY